MGGWLRIQKMAEEDIEDTKKLSPEERIRRLREIAKRDEEEILSLIHI